MLFLHKILSVLVLFRCHAASDRERTGSFEDTTYIYVTKNIHTYTFSHGQTRNKSILNLGSPLATCHMGTKHCARSNKAFQNIPKEQGGPPVAAAASTKA